ncbi:hypothetical protein [Ensifer adhaerens]|nr:hypothetical protein [Ensifer adhaerens]
MAAVQRDTVGQPPTAGFIPSYRPGSDETALPQPLTTAAFTYDNALAAMAFLACGRIAAARSIGDALLAASKTDRQFRDGRLRNAYRAGAIAEPAALPGWWDADGGHWAEDEYQVSTALGNVAWAALALLQLHTRTQEPAYLKGAVDLGTWLKSGFREDSVGLTGGYFGFDPVSKPIPWKSTEHNIDALAVARWLKSQTADPHWDPLARSTMLFLDSMFDETQGFLIGTDPSGEPVRTGITVLDAQIWPLMAVPADERPAEWNGTTARIDSKLAVPGGYDFNDDRDGMWVEGTAQAALMFRLEGDDARAESLIASALDNRDAASGWLLATREKDISTGLAIDAAGVGGEFRYYRRPHLGATAWAVLAATGFNPFQPN